MTSKIYLWTTLLNFAHLITVNLISCSTTTSTCCVEKTQTYEHIAINKKRITHASPRTPLHPYTHTLNQPHRLGCLPAFLFVEFPDAFGLDHDLLEVHAAVPSLGG